MDLILVGKGPVLDSGGNVIQLGFDIDDGIVLVLEAGVLEVGRRALEFDEIPQLLNLLQISIGIDPALDSYVAHDLLVRSLQILKYYGFQIRLQ